MILYIYIYIYIGFHVKYPLFLSDLNETLNFLGSISKNAQISNFVKICLVRAEFFLADGRTDMTKLIVAFRNFTNAPKNFLASDSKHFSYQIYRVCYAH